MSLALAILLAFLLTRLAGIENFPLFLDETTHIELGERVLTTSPFYNAWLGRLGTGWLQYAVQSYASEPVWTARTITVLSVLPGLAAAMALAYAIAGLWGLGLSGLLYLFSSYHFFFERLALGDPPVGSVVLVALYVAYRLSRRANLIDATLTGLVLFGAFVIKVSMIPYMSIPVLAALTLTKHTWRQRLRWLAVALVTMLGLSALFVVGLRLLGHDYLTNSVSYGLTSRAAENALNIFLQNFNPTTIFERISAIINMLAVYFGPVMLVIAAGAVGVLVARRRFYLVFCLLLPAFAMWINRTQETRFWLPAAAILLLCVAVVLADILRRSARIVQVAGVVVVFVWGGVYWLPFMQASMESPPDFPLPQWDREQYVLSDAAGYGLAQAADYLLAQQPQEVIGIVANCLALKYGYLGELNVQCPRITHDGSSINELAALLENSRSPGTYAVLEAINYLPATAPGTLITIIERPPPGPRLTVYDLTDHND